MSEHIEQEAVVPEELGGKRLDQVAACCFTDFSRARLQEWIKAGVLTVNGSTAKTRDKMLGGEKLELVVEVEGEERWEAEPVPLDVVYEDDDLIVINKPAGLVVHPAAGNRSGTLLNGLLYRWPDIDAIPRAGIVHRLDKETTGLMVVAKTLKAHTDLVAQLQEKSVSREYEAVGMGVMTGGGTVDEPIGRHPTHRQKMAVTGGGKHAVTHYRVIARFRAHTHIRVKLETGRTHQIRVHMSHINYPLVGDPVYAGRHRIPKGCSVEVSAFLRGFGRQALHARRLGLVHPETGEYMEWEAPLPEDMQKLLQILKQDQQEHEE